MTADLDDRVRRALQSLADEAEPSPALRDRALTTSAPRRGRWLAAAAAVALVAVVGVLLARVDDDRTAELTTVDEPQPETTVATAPPAVVIGPQVGEAIDPSQAGADLLVLDEHEVRLVTAGGTRAVSARPAVDAFPDGEGGIVLQEQSEWRSIVWLPAGGTPTLLVSDPGDALLRAVHDGFAYFTLRTGEGETVETLHRVRLAPGEPTPEELGVTAGTADGTDAVAADDRGRLFLSGCHLQCSISVHGEPDPIVPAEWITGLDIAGTTMAFIRFEFAPETGSLIRPALVLAALDGSDQRVVPLGDRAVSSATVDLGADGSTAVVSFITVDPALRAAPDAQLVDGLATDTPRVRTLTGVRRARFATGVAFGDMAPQGDPAAVVHSFLDALRRGDDAEAQTYLSEHARTVTPLEGWEDDHAWLVDGGATTETYVGTYAVQPSVETTVVTVVADSPTGNPNRHAAAFVVGFDEDDEMRIDLLPMADDTAVRPPMATPVRGGDSITVDIVPVEGGAAATVNNAPVETVVDHEAMTTAVVLPDWVDDADQVVVTFVFASPEIPSAMAMWFPVTHN